MSMLRQFRTNDTAEYGNAEHPEFLPAKEALKRARASKALDFLIVEPEPNVTLVAAKLGVSRSTCYRLLAEPEFQTQLRKALDGRLSLLAKRALDTIEKTLTEGSPALRFKAATWMLERLDKLSAMGSDDDAQRWREAQGSSAVLEQIVRLEAQNAMRRGAQSRARSGPTIPAAPSQDVQGDSLREAAHLDHDEQRRADDEIADAELLDGARAAHGRGAPAR